MAHSASIPQADTATIGFPFRPLVIVPAYNEAENIQKTLEGLLEAQPRLPVVVVNDGSADATEELARRFPVFVLSHPCNLGYGAALQTGFRFASRHGYSHLIQFDADSQHNPADISAVLDEFKKPGIHPDIVIGSRFLGDPHFRLSPTKTLALSVFRLTIRICTGVLVTDPTSGIRGLSRQAFTYYAVKDRFPSDFPDADILIDMLLRGFRVSEVSAGHRQRTHGTSMHAGLRPLVYVLKVFISTLSILVNFALIKRTVQR